MNEKELTEDLEQQISELPEGYQNAVKWIVNNIDYVKQIVSNPVDEDCFNELMDSAIQHEDYLSEAILVFQKLYNNRTSL